MNKNFLFRFPSQPNGLKDSPFLPQVGIFGMAGMLFIFFVFLGATKISSWTLIEAEGEYLWLYQITIGLELIVGLLFLLRPSTALPWLSATLLSAGFVLFSFFGPDIKKCHCLGELAEIGPSARLAIALLLFALSTLGTALTLNSQKTMKQQRLILFLVGAVLALTMLFMVWGVPALLSNPDHTDSAYTPEVVSSSSELISTLKREPISRERGEATWNVMLKSGDEVLSLSGSIQVPSTLDYEQDYAEVNDGRSFIDKEGWPSFLEKDPGLWFLPTDGFPSKVIRAHVDKLNGDRDVLVLDLGSLTNLEITVTDLKDQPIPNARVRVYGVRSPLSIPQTADENGIWNGWLLGTQRLTLRINAPGYGVRSLKVDVEMGSMQRSQVKLGRVLAIARVNDRREWALVHTRGHSEQTSTQPISPETDQIRQAIEEGANLDPFYESLTWILVFEKQHWIDEVYTVSRTHRSNPMLEEKMEVPLKHILDPLFEPCRFSDSWPHELAPIYVQLESESQFSGGVFPASIRLAWRKIDEEQGLFHLTGHQTSPDSLTYTFFPPLGDYEVSTSNQLSDLEFGKAPTIVTLPEVQVTDNAVAIPRITAFLKSDCFYAGYVIEDNTGMPVEIGATLIESEHPIDPDSRAFMVPSTTWPQYRFFSGSSAWLWMQPSGGWPTPVGSALTINQPLDGEVLKIRTPREALRNVLNKE